MTQVRPGAAEGAAVSMPRDETAPPGAPCLVLLVRVGRRPCRQAHISMFFLRTSGSRLSASRGPLFNPPPPLFFPIPLVPARPDGVGVAGTSARAEGRAQRGARADLRAMRGKSGRSIDSNEGEGLRGAVAEPRARICRRYLVRLFVPRPPPTHLLLLLVPSQFVMAHSQRIPLVSATLHAIHAFLR